MIALEDRRLIAGQMGRMPQGLVAVAARCPAGHPAVITTYPLRRRGLRLMPFPTLYWLTCPQLRTAVAHLERDGLIATLEAELALDAELRASVARDHDDYILRRWQALTPGDRAQAQQHGLDDAFLGRGIGGMHSRAAVKCLHMHLAHHLAGGNTLGALLVQRYGIEPCHL